MFISTFPTQSQLSRHCDLPYPTVIFPASDAAGGTNKISDILNPFPPSSPLGLHPASVPSDLRPPILYCRVRNFPVFRIFASRIKTSDPLSDKASDVLEIDLSVNLFVDIIIAYSRLYVNTFFDFFKYFLKYSEYFSLIFP